MKKISIIILAILITACNPKGATQTQAQRDAEVDSFSVKTYGRHTADQAKHQADSLIKKTLLDTTGLYKSPVKIISAKLVKKEYSSYRDIQLEYKNVSNKTIEGIKFSWYGINAFGEPADMGNTALAGFGGGFIDDALKANHKSTSQWSISSQDGKKVVLAWPTEVAFSDGTKWNLK